MQAEYEDALKKADKYKSLDFGSIDPKEIPEISKMLKKIPGFENVNLDELYASYKKSESELSGAKKVIDSNTGIIFSGDVDVLNRFAKDFNEYTNSEEFTNLFETCDERIKEAFEFEDLAEFVSALELLNENGNKFTTPETYAAASLIIERSNELAARLKNIKDIDNPDIKAMNIKLLSILSPLEKLAKNSKLLDAFSAYENLEDNGASIFRGLSAYYSGKKSSIINERNQIQKDLAVQREGYLDSFTALQKQAETLQLEQKKMAEELKQINIDFAYCTKSLELVSAKQALLKVDYAHRDAREKVQEINKKQTETLEKKNQEVSVLVREKNVKKVEVANKYKGKTETAKTDIEKKAD